MLDNFMTANIGGRSSLIFVALMLLPVVHAVQQHEAQHARMVRKTKQTEMMQKMML